MMERELPPEAWERFLEELAACGIVSMACKKAKISRSCAYNHRRDDEGFRKRWKAAEERGIDAMEDELSRRGFKGTLRPVFHQGEKVGSIREYDTTAAIFILKGKRPDKFKDRIANEHSGPDGKPIEVSDARDRIARRLAGLAAGSGTPEGSGGSQ